MTSEYYYSDEHKNDMVEYKEKMKRYARGNYSCDNGLHVTTNMTNVWEPLVSNDLKDTEEKITKLLAQK